MGQDRAALVDRQPFGAHPLGERAMARLSRVAGLLSLLLLGWTASAAAAVTYNASAGAANNYASSTAVTVSLTAGDTAVVVISALTGAPIGTTTISNVTDTATNTYTQRATTSTGNAAVFVWSTASGAIKTTGSITVTVTFSQSTLAYVAVADYSGVAALGATATNTGTTANPTVSLTTQDANN